MINHILKFISYQQKLVSLFYNTYPDVKDFEFMFDFPQRGDFELDNEKWSFLKHGVGIRFTRSSPHPHIAIDIIDNFSDPKIIDVWRILLYLESIGIDESDENIVNILNNMITKGLIKKFKYKKYRLLD